jgi:hypothetical protein
LLFDCLSPEYITLSCSAVPFNSEKDHVDNENTEDNSSSSLIGNCLDTLNLLDFIARSLMLYLNAYIPTISPKVKKISRASLKLVTAGRSTAKS